jgi:urease accessory protein
MGLSELALLLADGRLPTGGHTHSGGLEPAISGGLQTQEIPSFLRGRLHTVSLTEAALAACATRCADARAEDELEALDGEALARLPSPPLREASCALGSSLLRTAVRLLKEPPGVLAYRRRSTRTPRPVALGVVASAAGLSPHATAAISLHDDAMSVASAAVRLLPVESSTAYSWVADLSDEIAAAASSAAATASSIKDLPSYSAPSCEIESLLHPANERRLFAT